MPLIPRNDQIGHSFADGGQFRGRQRRPHEPGQGRRDPAHVDLAEAPLSFTSRPITMNADRISGRLGA
jgi:hypothetical protein